MMSATKDMTDTSNKVINLETFLGNCITELGLLLEHMFNKAFQIHGLNFTAEWE